MTIASDCGRDNFQVRMDNPDTTLGTMSTDDSGNGSASFTVPSDAAEGTHTVTVIDSVGHSGTMTFTVDPDSNQPGASSSSATPAASNADNSNPSDPSAPRADNAAFVAPGARSTGISSTDVNAAVAIAAGAVGISGMCVLRLNRRRRSRWED